MREKASFSSEAGLCATFIASLPAGWVAYPETCGFDIVVVRKVDGCQVAIEAKMTLNAKVIHQIVEKSRHYSVLDSGPDFRAVLVPHGVSHELAGLCNYLGITVIRQKDRAVFDHIKRWAYQPQKFEPSLPEQDRNYWTYQDEWWDCWPAKPLKLPDYIPDVRAGMPSPLTLTPWKVKAIKLSIIVKRRGYCVREDFKHLALNHRLFMDPHSEWLTRTEIKGRWGPGPGLANFKKQHPVNYDQIEADYEKWKPSDPTDTENPCLPLNDPAVS